MDWQFNCLIVGTGASTGFAITEEILADLLSQPSLPHTRQA